jgi:hypothetical protein
VGAAWRAVDAVDRGGAGFLLPVLNAVSNPTLPKGYPNPEEPTIDSPLYWPAAAPLAPAAGVAYYLFAVWIAGGLVMLALRYRRYGPPDPAPDPLAAAGYARGAGPAIPSPRGELNLPTVSALNRICPSQPAVPA